MLDIGDDRREELIEALWDLKHDLGKYIKLPVFMLGRDALPVALAEEVVRAVEATRKGPAGAVSAAVIFSRFENTWGGVLGDTDGFDAIRRALAGAIELAARAKSEPGSMIRAEVESVLSSVAEAVAALLTEVEGG